MSKPVKFTEKQAAFIQLRIQGVKQEQAAILAGYSQAGASVIASKMSRTPKFIEAINGGGIPKAPAAPAPEVDSDPRLKDSYEDALAFFIDVMNNPRMADGMRFEAAKQLLPYQAAKKGDIGKKAGKLEKAAQTATGRLATQPPPGARPRMN